MLELTTSPGESFDEATNEFLITDGFTLHLEHSLSSLSKWESKWEEPFLSSKDKTTAQTVDYVKFMTITSNVPADVYAHLSSEDFSKISEYIDKKMTATWFNESGKSAKGSGEQVTSEIIYYWMVALNIPFECENWHLNKLITLIKVCNLKNAPPEKMGRSDAAAQRRAENARRRAQLKTSG